jgi:PTH1 family peptidyl-tRNA hydrolase
VTGLGNIGGEYHDTRHNIGFDVVDLLAIKYEGKWSTDKLGDICTIKFKGRTLVLLKPSTYMNLSGKAVHYWMQKEKIPIERLLIITDDIAFPIETQKLKKNGSAGGHNGLKSIEESLGTQQYPRLRFGVGNDFGRGRQVEFVLGKWDEKDIPLLQKKIQQSISIIESFVTIGLDRTMNVFNNKKVSLEEEKSKPKKVNPENKQEPPNS